MEEAILSTLKIVGWLGVVLGILVLINTVCGVIFNVNKKVKVFLEKFYLKDF